MNKLNEATVRLAREAAIIEVCNKCGLAGKYELTEAVREYLAALFECDGSAWCSKDFEKLAKEYLKMDKSKFITNFDKVTRSKETLAAFIAGMMQDAFRGCPANFCDKQKAHCETVILQWLSEKVR